MTDLEYKVGDSDYVGAILTQNGSPINLTGYTASFIMKATSGTRITLACTLGAYVNGTNVAASEGGVTIVFGSTATATAGQYRGEFIITNGSSIAHIPSGNNYFSITIWESL